MYRGVFTIGIALISGNNFDYANALTDYSYITDAGTSSGISFLGRCLTGLGPSGNNNGVLGGFYFNGNHIPNTASSCPSQDLIQPAPGTLAAGVINLRQCGQFNIAAEGVYTCTLMNSSMMNESIRFGIYFNRRSELFDLYIPSLNHLSSLYTATPVIDTPSSSTVTVTIGSSLTLSCTSRGSPPDTFTWRKNDDPTVLQSTSIIAVDYTSTNAVFRADYSIDSVTTSDNGTYTCTVTNLIGSDSTTIIVVATGMYVCITTEIQIIK